ncbi:MAG: hypothetical protein LBM75_06090 [Myxococcales bacterium]|jgi:hypothetical protein|nr:hypothetical protein [Myxococcales bacterium]
MAWTIALILLGNWVVGMFSGAQLGLWIHGFLIGAVLSLLIGALNLARQARTQPQPRTRTSSRRAHSDRRRS